MPLFLDQYRTCWRPDGACRQAISAHNHVVMCLYWADAASIGPVLATNGMFTGILTQDCTYIFCIDMHSNRTNFRCLDDRSWFCQEKQLGSSPSLWPRPPRMTLGLLCKDSSVLQCCALLAFVVDFKNNQWCREASLNGPVYFILQNLWFKTPYLLLMDYSSFCVAFMRPWPLNELSPDSDLGGLWRRHVIRTAGTRWRHLSPRVITTLCLLMSLEKTTLNNCYGALRSCPL